MKILDSNIFIYASKDEHKYLRLIFEEQNVFYTSVSKIEALGYPQLKESERVFFENVFANIKIIQINEAITEKAIILKQAKKMALGDAIIGASALVYGLELYTRNTKDFEWIEGLRLHNPIQ